VVIAIIALLVSILIPSLKRARDLAATAVCLSQMRALGLGLGMYVNEGDQYPPIMGVNDAHPWWPVRLFPFVGIEQQFRCPTAVKLYPGVNSDTGADGGYPGGWSVTNTDPPTEAPYWTTYMGNRMQTWVLTGWGSDKYGFFVSSAQGRQKIRASHVARDSIYVVDGKVQKWTHPSIYNETVHMPDYANPLGLTHVGNYHAGRFNALFADGHAETIEYGTSYPSWWSIQQD